MKKNVNLKGKTIECACNALTPFLFTQIFHEDFLRAIIGFRGYAGKDANILTDDEVAELSKRTEVFSKLCFVMAKQAEIKDAKALMDLSIADFYIWLSDIEPQAFSDAEVMTVLLALWQGNTDTTVESKN